MKFKKFLAMTLAAAMVFTGVNVSGLSGVTTVYAATTFPGGLATTESAATPVKVEAAGHNPGYAASVQAAINALNADPADKIKDATITIKEPEKGKAPTDTLDNAITIDQNERITLNLNGRILGNSTVPGSVNINVVCGTLTVNDTDAEVGNKQIGTITVGGVGITPVQSKNADGTWSPKDEPQRGTLNVGKTFVDKIIVNNGAVSVNAGSKITTVDFGNDAAATPIAKSSSFTLDGGAVSTFDTIGNSLSQLNIKGGIVAQNPVETKIKVNDVPTTMVAMGEAGTPAVEFDTTVSRTVLAAPEYAISNDVANAYIAEVVKDPGRIAAIDAAAAIFPPTPATITALNGKVDLKGLRENLFVTENEKYINNTSISASTLPKISSVKTTEKVPYVCRAAGGTDENKDVYIDKYVTGWNKVKDSVERLNDGGTGWIQKTNVLNMYGPTVISHGASEWAVTVTPDAADKGTSTINKVGNTGLTYGGPVAYDHIYFTTDPTTFIPTTEPVIKADDMRFYMGALDIQYAAQKAEKTIDIIRTQNAGAIAGTGLAFGLGANRIEKDLTVTPSKESTYIKTTIADAGKTYYAYTVTEKPHNYIEKFKKNGGTLGVNNLSIADIPSAAGTPWKIAQLGAGTKIQEVKQIGTYGFAADKGKIYEDRNNFKVDADTPVARNEGTGGTVLYIGLDAIKMLAQDKGYLDDLKSIVEGNGKYYGGTPGSTLARAIYTDQGAYVLKQVPVQFDDFGNLDPVNSIQVLPGEGTNDEVLPLPVYTKPTNTIALPEIKAYDWYINKTDEYTKDKPAADEQEKKASYSQAELEQEIGKAVAQAKAAAIEEAILNGEVVKTETAKKAADDAVAEATKDMISKADAETAKNTAVAEATKGMKTEAEAKKAADDAVAEATKDMVTADAAKKAADDAVAEATKDMVTADVAKKATADAVAEATKDMISKADAQKATDAAVKAAQSKETVKTVTAPVEKGQQVVSKKNIYKVTNVSKKTVAFAGTMSTAKTIKIAKSVKINGVTYKVTSIAAKALKGNKTAKKVVIPNTVKKIGKKAFNGMNGVTFKASKSLKTKANKAK